MHVESSRKRDRITHQTSEAMGKGKVVRQLISLLRSDHKLS